MALISAVALLKTPFTQKESYESIQAPEECIVYVKKLYFHRIFFYLFRREETEKKQVELARI